MKRLPSANRILLSVIAGLSTSSVAFLSGCAVTAPVMESVATPASVGGTMSGNLHGGQFAVYNAVVRLYSVGTSGYGTGSTLLATSAKTDINGNFQFTKLGTTGGVINTALPTWQCPTTGNPQIYITATGGNTQGTGVTTTNNAASVMMSAIGQCSTLSTGTIVWINEITTAASVFALEQYINPGTTPGTLTIGTSSTAQGTTGLNNAVTGIVNVASIGTGQPVTSNSYAGVNTALGVTLTATPESAKLITIADILAACVNSTSSAGSACTDLFANALPPVAASITSQPSATFGTAQDTLQAAYYMATNPTDSNIAPTSCLNNSGAATTLACLFGLATASSPFQTGLASAPTDWTLGIALTAAGTCTNTNSFISGPNKAAVDASGNIWFINAAGSTAGAASLAEISPTGVPLFCAGAQATGRGVSIDQTGNVWGSFNNAATALATAMMEVPLGSSTATPVFWTVLTPSLATAVDASGNVFYSASATGGSIYEFADPGTNTTPFASTQIASGFDGTTAAQIGYLAADSTGRIYGTSSTIGDLVVAVPAGGGSYTAAEPALPENAYGIAIDSNNYIYAGTTCCGTSPAPYRSLLKITPGTGAAITETTSAYYVGGVNGTRSMTLDGAANMWYGFELPVSGTVTYGIGEAYTSGSGTTATFTPLSPSGPAPSACTTTGCLTGGGYQKTSFTITADMAIDPSGNVWVLDSGTNSTTVPTTGTGITEVVGAAVPVVAPLSVAVKNNTLATKP